MTLLALASSATAQLPPEPDHPGLRAGYLAWSDGDYPEALERYLEVLRDTRDPELVAEIAHLTGEPYAVRELAPDARSVRLAPDGGHVTFEVDEDGRTVTKVLELASGDVVATLDGSEARPGPGGRVAYFHIRESPAAEAALQAIDQARAQGDRAAFMSAQRRYGLARARATEVRVRATPDAPDVMVSLESLVPVFMEWAPAGHDLFVGALPEGGGARLLRVVDGDVTERMSLGPVAPVGVLVGPGGEILVPLAPRGVALVEDGQVVQIVDDATDPSLSADGTTLAYLADLGGGITGLQAMTVSGDGRGDVRTVVRTDRELSNPAVSPDGRWIAYQDRVVHDEEIFAVASDGSGEPVQLSKEIQHDLFPTWVGNDRVLAAKGEGRHRRSYLYALDGSPPLKLFHNNTIRTIAPEYEWLVTPGGDGVVIVSERDGDTVSPERGLYFVDLGTPVTRDEVLARLEAQLAAERDLRERGRRAFEPIAADVRRVTEQVDLGRIYLAARHLYEMGSKHITQPGNAAAIDYLADELRRYGYEPELQWFEPRPGIRTANVVARLPGTRDPELVYVVSSHFDSVERGPGADDDSSGTTALLEAARVLKDHPGPTTLEFAFFTGEEAGLLGSREYVRRAVESGKRIVGALNNDMIGWANDHRLDNTIRYSNPGIRDIQHAAGMQFGDLITYDALYYKNTDAHAYYEEYGDIVGGIGSYPVLGNPHYHQFTDRLETIDQRLVQAVSRTTVATLMLLAHAPARLRAVTVEDAGGGVALSWEAAGESNIASYEVRWTTPEGRSGDRTVRAGDDDRVRIELDDLPAGTRLAVRAVNRDGMAGWDWARTTVGG